MEREKLAVLVAETLVRHLPGDVADAAVEAVTADLVVALENREALAEDREGHRLAVLTTIGRNRSGIVHEVAGILAALNVDIVDIDQTLVRDNFAMMMVVDPTEAKEDFQTLKTRLKEWGQKENVGVFIQYEDLLRAMHRI